MSQVESAQESVRERPALLARLDKEPVSKRCAVFILIIAAALSLFWLSEVSYFFVTMVVNGEEWVYPQSYAWVPVLRRVLGIGIIALFAGVLSARTVRRFKWAVGPCLIAVLALVYAIMLSVRAGQEGILIPAEDPFVLHYRLQIQWLMLPYFGSALIFAALGGLLSPWVFRRVRASTVATIVLAWTAIGPLVSLLRWLWMLCFPSGVSYTTWSLVGLATNADETLPYFLGGLWIAWAMRGRRPWAGVVIIGLIPAFQVLRGHIYFVTVTGDVIAVIALRTLRALSSAGIGGLLGVVFAGEGRWRRLLWPAVLSVSAIILAMIVSSVAHGRQKGISAAIETPVSNGEIVLVKKGEAIGAFIPTKQTSSPERISYDWYFRTDGQGTFRAEEAEDYESGHVEADRKVGFGPFVIPWSFQSDGAGWLYYGKSPDSPVEEDDIRICLTHERDLEQIDAFDHRWIFKGSLSDEGIRLAAPDSPAHDGYPTDSGE